MADVRPFRGIRYNPAKAPDLTQVITQPYDKISKPMQQAYYKQHPRSFVRLILSDAADPYAESKQTMEKWLREQTLVRDHTPAFYVIHQDFEISGVKRTRKGFIGVVRVEEFDKGTILPHERTLSKPKADRLNLLRTTEKDYEQIFMLYPDAKGEVDRALEPKGPPLMQAADEYGVTQKVWAITDQERLATVRALMSDKVLLIADGHHRYETGLNYRQEQEKAGAVPPDAALRFKTTAFININDPGLVILPTHRLLYNLPGLNWDEVWRKIKQHFHVYQVCDELLASELAGAVSLTEHVFGLHAGKGKSWILRLTDKPVMDKLVKDRSADYKGLDVTVLHSLIIERIFGIVPEKIEDHVAYERNPGATLARVDSSEYQVALLLNPTRADQVSRVAANGERMPQKSTDFYPKLVSGLVFFDVAVTERV